MDGWRRQVANTSVLVALLGLAFVVGGVTLWYQEFVTAASVSELLFSLVIHVLFGGVVLALGIHIERSELPLEEQFAVLAWCYGGFGLMVGLSVWGHLDAVLSGTLTVTFASDFVVFSSLGGAFGVIAGLNSGRAKKNRQLAERTKEQRETLTLLTRLVSHDIRNDMAVISGYTDMVGEHVGPEGQPYVEVIDNRIDDTIDLLEDTSTLVKSIDEDREFESVDLSGVLETEVERIRENHPEVTLETEIDAGLVVTADSLLQQLFGNLLSNAVAHNDPTSLTITVRAGRDEEMAEVVVSDTGRGIPPGDRERLFELGEQGADSDGDGIGLYLVSRLATLYGGGVDVADSPAGGALFRVRLPLADGEQL